MSDVLLQFAMLDPSLKPPTIRQQKVMPAVSERSEISAAYPWAWAWWSRKAPLFRELKTPGRHLEWSQDRNSDDQNGLKKQCKISQSILGAFSLPPFPDSNFSYWKMEQAKIRSTVGALLPPQQLMLKMLMSRINENFNTFFLEFYNWGWEAVMRSINTRYIILKFYS